MDAVGTQRRGRGSRKKARLTTKIEMLPHLVRGLPLTEPMNEEQVREHFWSPLSSDPEEEGARGQEAEAQSLK